MWDFSLRNMAELDAQTLHYSDSVREGKGIMEYLESERHDLAANGHCWDTIYYFFLKARGSPSPFLEPGA